MVKENAEALVVATKAIVSCVTMQKNVIVLALPVRYWKLDTFSAILLSSETDTEWYIVLVFFYVKWFYSALFYLLFEFDA